MTDPLTDTVCAATAEYGMQQLANWLPASRHAELRDLLYYLALGAITARRDATPNWYEVPEPSVN